MSEELTANEDAFFSRYDGGARNRLVVLVESHVQNDRSALTRS